MQRFFIGGCFVQKKNPFALCERVLHLKRKMKSDGDRCLFPGYDPYFISDPQFNPWRIGADRNPFSILFFDGEFQSLAVIDESLTDGNYNFGWFVRITDDKLIASVCLALIDR